MKTILHRSFEDYGNVGQKMRLRGLLLFGLAMLAFLILPGCFMFLPYSGMPPQDKNLPIVFIGGVPAPNQEITIEAYNGQTWVPIGTATSFSSPISYPEFGTAYEYVTSILIPSEYWGPQCSSIGEGALVRSLLAGIPLRSWRLDNWSECALSNLNAGDWASNCTDSPHVKVGGSPDFRDFGVECVALINKIRYEVDQTLPPLQRYEAGECAADSDAQCNYEWERDNCVPDNPDWTGSCSQAPTDYCCAHRCPGPGAQNECNFKGYMTHYEHVLDICIWQKMYIDEQACLKRGCPDDCAPCGHYENMISREYTKVSCGLYTWYSENGYPRYKAVMDFYK